MLSLICALKEIKWGCFLAVLSSGIIRCQIDQNQELIHIHSPQWAAASTYISRCLCLSSSFSLSLPLFFHCSPAKASPDLIATLSPSLSLYCSILMNRIGDIAFCLQCYYTNHLLMWPSYDTNKHKYWWPDSAVAKDPSQYWAPGKCAWMNHQQDWPHW